MSMISFGLGITQPGPCVIVKGRGVSGGGTWQPARYSEVYDYWEAGPLATYLYQTNANTTPVAANNDPVGRWKSTKLGQNLDQGAAGPRPVASLSGGQWSVVFDGVNDTMSVAFGATQSQPTTIYCVTTQPGTAQGVYVFDGVDGTNRQAIITDTAASNGNPDAFAGSELKGTDRWINSVSAWGVVFNGASSKIRYTRLTGSTVVNVTGNTGSNSIAGFTLAARYNFQAGSYLGISFRFIGIYAAAHDDTKLDEVLADLRFRFSAT